MAVRARCSDMVLRGKPGGASREIGILSWDAWVDVRLVGMEREGRRGVEREGV